MSILVKLLSLVMTNKAVLNAILKLLQGLAKSSKTEVDDVVVAAIMKMLEGKV